jgi:hypothetical protein
MHNPHDGDAYSGNREAQESSPQSWFRRRKLDLKISRKYGESHIFKLTMKILAEAGLIESD